MKYSFDNNKKAINLAKHGLDFDDAKLVIESDQTLTFEDSRFDYGEQRFITIGLLQKTLAVIVTSETENQNENKVRIISMRKADKHEQAIYYKNIG